MDDQNFSYLCSYDESQAFIKDLFDKSTKVKEEIREEAIKRGIDPDRKPFWVEHDKPEYHLWPEELAKINET